MSESLHHDGVSEDLRAALDAWLPSGPREEFRAYLAVQFISGEAAVLSEDDQRAVEEQLSRWRPVSARAAFCAALREAFVRGRLVAGVPLRITRGPILRWRRPAIAAFAAAAALLLWLGAGLFTPKGWRLVDSSVASELRVDGQSVAFADSLRLGEAFANGNCLVETTDTPLQMVSLGEGIVIEVIPETSFEVLERQPGDELLTLRLHSGGIRVATCPKHGDCVLVLTPDTEVRLAGRALGVTVYPEGTCLCVLDGRGTLGPFDGSAPQVVASHTQAWVSRGTREVKYETGALHHEESLAQFTMVSDRYFY